MTGDALDGADGRVWPVARRLLVEVVRPYWRIVALTVGCMILTAATNGALPFLMQTVADEVFVGKNERLLYLMPVAVIAVMAFRGLIDWVSRVTDAWLGNRIVADLRLRMFTAIAGADLGWLQRTHSARFITAFVNDTPLVDRAAAKTMTSLVKNGASVVFLLLAMLVMDWRLTLLVAIGLPVAFGYLGRQRQRITRSVRRSMQDSGDLGSHLSETFHGIRVVRAYGHEAREIGRFGGIVERLLRQNMKTERSRALTSPVTEAAAGIGFAAAIFYGGWQGIYGTVTVGHFMGFMTAAMLMYQPLKALATAQASMAEGVAAAQRVFSVMDHRPAVIDRPDARPLAIERGGIRFEGVTFGYDHASPPVLTDVTLDIQPGETVALVGQSGAGKTTVLNLVLRFFDPRAGRILIDGQDLRDVTQDSLRRSVALLTQDPILFDDTVGANIRYGLDGASDAAVERAARAAQAHDFIQSLPDGYATRIGEDGGRLSGGERQRIAFARAMLRDAPIILLDEPTSALDAVAEARIQEVLERLRQGRTVIMIAHRLSTVQRADRIFVMERGRVVESGRPAELMARRGRYHEMVRTQSLADLDVAPQPFAGAAIA